MNRTATETIVVSEGDMVLREIWRIKDARSAARGHDVHRLFAEAREGIGAPGNVPTES